jgi:hypothetical protein
LLDELRLSPQGYWPAYRAAMARVLAKERAQLRGAQIGPAEEAEATEAFRRESGLTGESALASWQVDNRLSAEQFAAMMREEAQVRWAQLSEHSQILEALPDYLRITNLYTALAARAKDKTALEHSPPTLADTGMTEEELLEWCFVEVLGRNPPRCDVLQGSRELGFDTPDAWRRAAIREFVYRRTAT